MPRKKEPYTLFKRKPQNIYYYRLNHLEDRTAHSTGKKNKSDAVSYVLALLKVQGELEVDAFVTLGEFTRDFFIPGKCYWLEEKKKKGKEKSKDLIQQHRGRLVNYIQPKFAHRELAKISASEIDKWLAGIDRANKTKNYILDTMKIIWGEAKKSRVVSENIVNDIEKYRANSKERDSFEMEEIAKLFPKDSDKNIEIWGNVKYTALFNILATTGMRLGEVLALKWGDIVIKDNGYSYLRVDKAQKKIDMSIGEVKNKIPRIGLLFPQVLTLLNRWRDETIYSSDNDLIFPNLKGGLLQQNEVRKKLSNAIKVVGINTNGRNIYVHSFRHTFNTYYRAILPDVILRKFTGHMDSAMTDHYDHPTLENMAKDLETYQKKMNDAWGRIYS